MYDQLPSKRAFSYALATIFLGWAVLEEGRIRQERHGASRLARAAVRIGPLMFVAGFGYILWAIFITSGPPWR